MDKIRKWLIGAGITAALLGAGNIAKTNMMPPVRTLKEEAISHTSRTIKDGPIYDHTQQDLYRALFGSFFTNEFNSHEAKDAKSLGIIRIDPNNPRFAVLKSTTESSKTMDISYHKIKTDANSLPELLNSGILEKIMDNPDDSNYLEERDAIFRNSKDYLMSPVTKPKNIIGIGYNYLEHAKEVGETKAQMFKGKNMVAFRKEINSLCGPYDTIKIPKGVKLLDYEAELGIVIGKRIDKDTKITKENFSEYVAGYTLVNDISARDIQLLGGGLLDRTKGFRKAKSYHGFCPVGPVFRYGNPIGPAISHGKNTSDFELNQHTKRKDKFYHLQKANTNQMINPPYEILTELQRRLNSDNKKEYRIFVNQKGERNYSLEAGDLISTGTPAGVAFNFDIKYLIGCGGKQGFIDFEEKNNEKYLRKGDISITYSKKLGYQKHKIE